MLYFTKLYVTNEIGEIQISLDDNKSMISKKKTKCEVKKNYFVSDFNRYIRRYRKIFRIKTKKRVTLFNALNTEVLSLLANGSLHLICF